MRNLVPFLLLTLVLCHGLTMAMGYSEKEEDYRREGEGGGGGGERDRDWLLLQDSKRVIETDAGDVRVVRSIGGRIVDRPMHIGFITMEPKTLFIPHYIDSSLILFVRRGEARVGCVHKDELVERPLKIGDIYSIPAGSAFYLINTEKGQKLHIISSIDPSESLGLGLFQSFFFGGGTYPASILSGFGHETLSNAFNVSREEVEEFFSGQDQGPIVFILDSHSPSMWSKFLQLKEQKRLQHLKRMVEFQQDPQDEEQEGEGEGEGEEEEEEEMIWSWRKLLKSLFRNQNKKGKRVTHESPDSYNLYNRHPDFQNNYGWSIALDHSDYPALKDSGIGVYLINLTAGSMIAPHVNPTATEYGIVLRGSGRIQIVYPNGTSAINVEVREGDVFWIPRYFAFCQIASRTRPFEIFGFTTSYRKNRPRFLVGAGSLVRTLPAPQLATALGVGEDRLRNFTDAQREAVILPSAAVARPDKKVMREFNMVPRVMRSFGNDLIMD